MPATNAEPTHPSIVIMNSIISNSECGRGEKSIIVYQQWQVTWGWQLRWKMTENNSRPYWHSYLLYLKFKPTRKCVSSDMERSKSYSNIKSNLIGHIHIFIRCYWGCRQMLPKNSKAPLTGSNSRPISLLPTLSKLLEKIVFDQIQCYFTVNKLTTDFQHAYSVHSTYTNDW